MVIWVTPNMKIRAVNLGGWLVTEGWIKPSLFDGIQDKDFLLWRISETTFQLRVFKKQFMGTKRNGIDIVAEEKKPRRSETFEIVRDPSDSSCVRIKVPWPDGCFLQEGKMFEYKSRVHKNWLGEQGGLVTADSKGDGNWGDDDPSVFVITNDGGLCGEYLVTNGALEHIHSRKDFKFISENGLNAVRIPVGWWIASDPTPPLPYVGGSFQALDNAFLWAQKYEIKVIIVLHAAPGSQNCWNHSSTRDGSQEWGLSDQNIQQTVEVIDFLSASERFLHL
ncbi:uncharacterized protein LOC131314106 [Rhododendron vialii]|uniref:uncharacterized protein LOC131314106 n=1 Tax=Rhododendron vialii TaxID=182163 RepID=UPI00265D81C1|nr:uncharacterized protein LOC131314106 [Rhododendron vialii]